MSFFDELKASLEEAVEIKKRCQRTRPCYPLRAG